LRADLYKLPLVHEQISLFLKLLTDVQLLQYRSKIKLECGPIPNVMAALPNIGGALCSTPQSMAGRLTPTTGVPYSNAAKT